MEHYTIPIDLRRSSLAVQQARDDTIIAAASPYPLFTPQLLMYLTPYPLAVLYRRCERMAEAGRLNRIEDSNGQVAYSPLPVHVTRRKPWRKATNGKRPMGKRRHLGGPQIAHDLMPVKFNMAADLAGMTVEDRLWGHELRGMALPIIPDCFGVYAHKALAIEAHTGEEPLTRRSDGTNLIDKCYEHVRLHDLLKQELGVHSLQVLILVRTERGVNNVMRELRERWPGSGLFLATSEEQCNPAKPEALVGAIFASPKGEDLVRLFE
jgi:hypothetical protein